MATFLKKELFIQFTVRAFRESFSMYLCSSFSFGFAVPMLHLMYYFLIFAFLFHSGVRQNKIN